jgi:hypothetical protein
MDSRLRLFLAEPRFGPVQQASDICAVSPYGQAGSEYRETEHEPIIVNPGIRTEQCDRDR